MARRGPLEGFAKPAETAKAAVPDRGAALQGLLPPRKGPVAFSAPTEQPAATAEAPVVPEAAVEAPEAPVVVQPAAEATTPSAAPAQTDKPKASRAPAKPAKPRASAKSTGGVGNVPAYVPHDVLEGLQVKRRQTGLTYIDLLVDAFDQVSDEQLIASFSGTEDAGSSMMPRPRRHKVTAGVQINLRATTEQREWLDNKGEAVGAPSRSVLVAEVFRIYLGL